MGTIADLNVLTAPAAGDFLVVRDISDPLDKDKKLPLSEIGILELPNTWTANQAITGIATGSALTVTRNFAAAATDAPVVSIFQNNTGDDQPSLQIENYGIGSIFKVVDNGVQLFEISAANNGNIHIGRPDALVTERFSISGPSTVTAGMGFARYSADAGGPTMRFYKSANATVGVQGLLGNNYTMGNIIFMGSDGAAMQAGAWIRGDTDGTPAAGSMPGKLIFLTTPVGSVTPTAAMTILANNNVGIGTTAPSAASALHVYRASAATRLTIETGIGANASITFVTPVSSSYMGNTGTINSILTGTNSGDFALSLRSGGSIRISADVNFDATEGINLLEDGKVGIGVLAPYGRLHVRESAVAFSDAHADDHLIVENNGNTFINVISPSTGTGGVLFSDDARATGYISYQHADNGMRFYTNAGLLRMTLAGDGTFLVPGVYNATTAAAVNVAVLVTTGQLARSTSSRRYKKSIVDLDRDASLTLLSKLHPITYLDKAQENSPIYAGFIAEDVHKIGGDYFVGRNQDGEVDSIYYDRLTAPLVVGWQNHEGRIAFLEERIKKLEERKS